MGGVALPKFAGEAADEARHRVVELEAGVPAERPVAENPQRTIQ